MTSQNSLRYLRIYILSIMPSEERLLHTRHNHCAASNVATSTLDTTGSMLPTDAVNSIRMILILVWA